MHFDAMAIAVVNRTVNERTNVEIAAQFTVDAMEHIEIEARRDARGIVICVIQHTLILLQIDANHHPRAFPQDAPGAATEGAGFVRLEISKPRPRKTPDLPHRRARGG